MAQYKEGMRVKAAKTIHRSGGSAWPGDRGQIVKVTGDGYHVRWESGGWTADVVKDDEVERA
jgi:hypothetical protein